jgi:hypothetical protein
MPHGTCGNDRHLSALARELDPGVEYLVAKGSAVPAGEKLMEIPRRRSPHLAAARPSHFLGKRTIPRARQLISCEGEISKGAAFDLEACSDNRPTKMVC